MKTLTLDILNGRIVNLEKLEHLASGLGSGTYLVQIQRQNPDQWTRKSNMLNGVIHEISKETGEDFDVLKRFFKMKFGFVEGDEPRSLKTASIEELDWLIDQTKAFAAMELGFVTKYN